MQWNLETQTVSFWMCDEVFEGLKDYYFKLIRTDGWFILPHKEMSLLGMQQSVPDLSLHMSIS